MRNATVCIRGSLHACGIVCCKSYLPTIWDGVKITYHTVITFEGENFRKFVKNTIYAEKTLADCSQEHHTPNFMEKTFTNSYKPTKFVKVFFLGSFPIYIRYL